MNKLLGFIALLVIFQGCASPSRHTHDYLEELDTLYHTQYASGFGLYACGKSSLLNILNPWQGATGVSKQVFLARGGEAPPTGFSGEVIHLPLQRVVCMSSSHVAFMDALDDTELICGISGAKFISSAGVQARIAQGQIADVGYSSSLNYELLVQLKPDVIFLYGVSGENSAITDKLHDLGLKVVYIGDYLETSPLGRAEWINVFGEFLDRREQAQSLFDSIRTQYESVLTLASTVTSRPRVMLNAPWRDSWFVPGDRSFMVRLIDDAGGAYVCAGVDSDQSRPISTETAYVAASGADLWLNPGAALSLAELLSANPRFRSIPAVRADRVFNNNARMTPAGGNDFWESGVVFPQLVLQDMIHLLHPELLPNHQLYYFRQLH